VNLTDFLGKHAGQPCAIYGKGPSLFNHDFSQDPHVRICVNDAAYVVPKPTYLMMHDPTSDAKALIDRAIAHNPDVILVLPSCSTIDGRTFGGIVDGRDVVWYVKRDQLSHDPVRHACAGTMWGGKGTGTTAVHFSHIIGCNRVKLVAFDGKMEPPQDYACQFPATAPTLTACAQKHGSNFMPAYSWHYSRIARIMDGLLAYFGQERI